MTQDISKNEMFVNARVLHLVKVLANTLGMQVFTFISRHNFPPAIKQ
jgi:hypothetical protein